MAWKAALDAGRTPTHTVLNTGDWSHSPYGCISETTGSNPNVYWNSGGSAPVGTNVPICVRTIEPTPEAVYSPKGTFDCPSGYSAYTGRCNSDFPYLYGDASMNAYCTTQQDWATASAAPVNGNNWCTTNPANIN